MGSPAPRIGDGAGALRALRYARVNTPPSVSSGPVRPGGSQRFLPGCFFGRKKGPPAGRVQAQGLDVPPPESAGKGLADLASTSRKVENPA